MRSLAIALSALALAGAAQARDYRPPRTSFGQPDFSGIWTNTSVTMLQRPPTAKALVLTDAEAAQQEAMFAKFIAEALGGEGPVDVDNPPPVVKEVPNSDFIEMDLRLARIGGQARSSWIVDPPDGRLPLTDHGRKRGREYNARIKTFDAAEVRPPEERCLAGIGSPEGPPMMNTGFNGHYQFVQTPDQVAIHIEMNHAVRIVRLKDRSHPPAHVVLWMGDSVGWWEGETLVVETTNLNPKAGVFSLGGGFLFSPKTRVVERFTRVGADQILYEFTVEDADMFKQPWSGQMPFRRAEGPIYEDACHEGNYSLPNILQGARVQEKLAAAQAPGTPAPD